MISGTVFPDRQARLTVELMAADGQFQPFEFILDTGFTGDLSLSRRTLQQLAVISDGELPLELADGSRTSTSTWQATALWDTNPRPVLILESDGEPLLGMGLLWQNHITLEARPYGSLVIERL